jgi:hypothetical protein
MCRILKQQCLSCNHVINYGEQICSRIERQLHRINSYPGLGSPPEWGPNQMLRGLPFFDSCGFYEHWVTVGACVYCPRRQQPAQRSPTQQPVQLATSPYQFAARYGFTYNPHVGGSWT